MSKKVMPSSKVAHHTRSTVSVFFCEPSGLFRSAKFQHLHFTVGTRKFAKLPPEENGCVVVFNNLITKEAWAVLAKLAVDDVPVVLGPNASANEGIWELKSAVDARGGIFEISSKDEDFKLRLSSVAKASARRHLRISSISGFAGAAPKVFKELLPEMLRGSYSHWSYSDPAEAIEKQIADAESNDPMANLPGINAATQSLRSDRGFLDAEKIRELFGFTRAEIAKLIDAKPETIRVTPDAPALQETLKPYEKIARLLSLNSKPENFLKWLHAPNSEFEDKSPMEVIRTHGPDVVAKLVEDILSNRAG
ncbi:MAG: MbcA/ParS/Xre antitoxin family protein [Opitutaceae bacterium]|jgi:hypothetical protein